MAFLDENGVSRMWGQIKIYFQGRAALTAADDDKIMVIDNDDTETVNGSSYKKYKTLTLVNLATYIQGKIASAFAALDSPTFIGTPAAPTASAGTNTTQIATTAFVQQELSGFLASNDAMVFKGTLGTGGSQTTLPTTYSAGWTYKVYAAGTYAGNVCEVGDLIMAIVDRAGSGNLDSDWVVSQTNIDGAIATATIDSTIV